MNLHHDGAAANALPLFAWATAQDRRQHHADPLHIARLRTRFGLSRHRAELVARLAGIGPQDGR